MVWAGIWWNNRSDIVVISGTMTGKRYLDEIVLSHVLPIVKENNLIFQQDNARSHKGKIVMAELDSIDVLSSPARSPDLSLIEHIWDEV